VATQQFVECRQTQSNLMQPNQLVAQSFDTESTRPAQIEDQCSFFRPGFLPRRAVRTATVVEQPGNALRLMARQPLAQRRTRDAAAATDQAGIPHLFVQPNPNQASTLCGC
jgi:hypothetical protein